ncbi:DUF6114 domain-containing protein [Streptomyces sp. NPDC046215]|uniref:Uncharacterized protein n=1 Tax=Streptomyces stramineus TaxID=173861 RepID=A0ABP3LAI8_9ACTN
MLLRLLRGPVPARLRAWRRTRPFWAGVLLLLAGAELLVVPLAPWAVLAGLGLGGIAALGIGLALVTAGLFLWFLPGTRHYVGIHAVLLSVLSFAASNLGGFLLGMLLGIAGGAMGFAWTPGAPPEPPEPPAPEPGPPPGESTPGESTPGSVTTPPKTLAAVLPLVLLAGVVAPGRAPGDSTAPTAARSPTSVTSSSFAPHGFTLAGVSRVPTAAGPRKVMVLRMRAATLTDYRLRSRDGGPARYILGADGLRLDGRVTLYLSRFSGCLQGVLCLTFTPDTLPVPPVVPPFVFMTNVSAEQALVTSDTIVAERLTLTAEPDTGSGAT